MEIFIKNTIIVSYLLILLALIFSGKLRTVGGLVLLIPFKGIVISLGLALYGYQVVLFLLLLYHFLFDSTALKFPPTVLIYLLITAFITIIISLFFIDFVEVRYGNFFRQEGRFIAQLVLLFVFQFGLLFYLNSIINSSKDFRYIIRLFLIGCIILGLLGLVQLVIFLVSGVDILPINLRPDGQIRSGGLFLPGKQYFLRICSLGGEPKGFAITQMVGYAILVCFERFKILFFEKKYYPYIKIVLISSVVLSFSTSAWVLLAVMPILIFILDIVHLRTRIKLSLVKVFLFLIGFILIFIYWDLIYYILNARIFERDLTTEDFDHVIQLFLADQPRWLFFGSGLGNVHNLANAYVPSEYWYMGDTIIVAKSGYLKLISEQGIFGTLLFFFMLAYYFAKGAFMKARNKLIYPSLYTLVIITVFFLLRGYAFVEFIFAFSILIISLKKSTSSVVSNITNK